MKFRKIFLVSSLFYMFISSSIAGEVDDAEIFFQNYVELSHEFNVSLVKLYKDDALIKMYRRYPHGLERAMELTGVQWADLVTKFMPLSKARNDKSIYSNIVVKPMEEFIMIKADRYSTTKCYTDTGYYMILEKHNNEQYKIHEEYFETQVKIVC